MVGDQTSVSRACPLLSARSAGRRGRLRGAPGRTYCIEFARKETHRLPVAVDELLQHRPDRDVRRVGAETRKGASWHGCTSRAVEARASRQTRNASSAVSVHVSVPSRFGTWAMMW